MSVPRSKVLWAVVSAEAALWLSLSRHLRPGRQWTRCTRWAYPGAWCRIRLGQFFPFSSTGLSPVARPNASTLLSRHTEGTKRHLSLEFDIGGKFRERSTWSVRFWMGNMIEEFLKTGLRFFKGQLAALDLFQNPVHLSLGCARRCCLVCLQLTLVMHRRFREAEWNASTWSFFSFVFIF